MARRTKDSGMVINGHHVPLSPMRAKILACLLKNEGEAVPYKKLCSFLGSDRDGARAKRTLSQHVGQIKEALASKKTGYVIAVAHHVGYVFCKIAKPGQPATRR